MNILVYDHGLCTELAVTLARSGHSVAYCCPQTEAYPKSAKSKIGFGLEGVTRIADKDYERAVEDSDMVVFPDTFCEGKVEHLRKRGKEVWGAGICEQLEQDRKYMDGIQRESGLPTPKRVFITGVDKLIAHLKTVKDKWVKLSEFRGDIETFHHKDYDSSQAQFLGQMLVDFGANPDLEFVVEDPIDDAVEVGFDGIFDEGFLSPGMIGYEAKDKGYIGARVSSVPAPLLNVNFTLASVLRSNHCRSFVSTEVRVTKDGKGYLIDPTIRCPHPPFSVMLEMIQNIPEIITAFKGDVNPKYASKYGAAIVIETDWADYHWTEISIKPAVRHLVKLQRACRIDGKYWALPGAAIVATAVGLGSTPEDAIEQAEKTVEGVSCRGMTYDTSAVKDLLNTIDKGKKYGIPF